MSRPIKFRGKRIDNGEWEYGYYHEKDSAKDRNKAYIIPSFASALYSYEVDPETVGQYTNYYGLEFYDGDVISIACDCDNEYGCSHPDSIHLVVWDEETAGYALKSIRNGRMYPLDEGGAENMTVIGNIFDHTHLLKGDDTDV